MAKDRIHLQPHPHDVEPERLVREIADAGMMDQVIVAGPLEVVAQLYKLTDNQLATCESYSAAIAHKQADGKPASAVVSSDECSSQLVRIGARAGAAGHGQLRRAR